MARLSLHRLIPSLYPLSLEPSPPSIIHRVWSRPPQGCRGEAMSPWPQREGAVQAATCWVQSTRLRAVVLTVLSRSHSRAFVRGPACWAAPPRLPGSPSCSRRRRGPPAAAGPARRGLTISELPAGTGGAAPFGLAPTASGLTRKHIRALYSEPTRPVWDGARLRGLPWARGASRCRVRPSIRYLSGLVVCLEPGGRLQGQRLHPAQTREALPRARGPQRRLPRAPHPPGAQQSPLPPTRRTAGGATWLSGRGAASPGGGYRAGRQVPGRHGGRTGPGRS